MMAISYVPILKGKEGEFAALEALDPRLKAQMRPLIEVSPIPYDFTLQRNSKTLDQHLEALPDRLLRCWGAMPLYLQVPFSSENELLTDGICAMEALLVKCLRLGLRPIPTISTSSSPACIEAIRSQSNINTSGLCLRLAVSDFGEDVDSDVVVEDLLRRCGKENLSDVDLILDLGELGAENNTSILVARSILSMVPRKDEWRHVILAAASFPEDLSEVGSASVRPLLRREWTLWTALLRKPVALPRQGLTYGDYVISHPVMSSVDPRLMSMSASIRYTTKDGWLIVKGRGVRKFGFEQYFDLCKLLVEKQEYCGRAFSWGDQFIENCALHMAGPGNATTWRKVGVNHHITFVVRQVSNHLGV